MILLKIIRYIVFIPISLIVIISVFYFFTLFITFSLESFFGWKEKLGVFWFIFLLILIGITFFYWAWDMFKAVVSALIMLVTLISPSKKLSLWGISVPTIIMAILMIVSCWSNIFPLSWAFTFISIVTTSLIIGLSYSIIYSVTIIQSKY